MKSPQLLGAALPERLYRESVGEVLMVHGGECGLRFAAARGVFSGRVSNQ